MENKKHEKTELNELLQLVSFELNGEEFGIEILMVQEIIRMIQITKIPNTQDFIEGVVNLRGRVIPVVNLRDKLGMPPKEHDAKTRIVVVEILGKTIGFIVDSVSEVLRIPVSITETPPAIISSGINSEFIKSVGKLEDRLVILIDLEKILSHSDKHMLQEAE